METSKELAEMLLKREGFRNNNYGCGGSKFAMEVIEFETFELGNSDIYESMIALWGVNLLPISQEEFDTSYEESEMDIMDEFKHEYLKGCKDFLVKKFGHENLYCLWMTTQEGVITHYNGGEEDEYLERYIFPKDAMLIPISDLGGEGTLFVTDVHPEFWETESVDEPQEEAM